MRALILMFLTAFAGVSSDVIQPSYSMETIPVLKSSSSIVASSSDVDPTTTIMSSAAESSSHIFISSSVMSSHVESMSSAFFSSAVVSSASWSPAISTQIMPSKTSVAPPASSSMIPTITPTAQPVDFPLNLTFTDKDNKSCLWFDAKVQIDYDYLDANNISENGTHMLVSKDVLSKDGVCSNFSETGEESKFDLKFEDYEVALSFKSNKDSWVFNNISVTIKKANAISMIGAANSFSGTQNFTSNTNGVSYMGQKGSAFRCDQTKELDLATNANNTSIKVTFTKVQVQPFSNNGTAAKVVMCPSGETQPKSSSIVPIAVGCALAGLIVIVLIAYLIGRRKSDGRGYQQV